MTTGYDITDMGESGLLLHVTGPLDIAAQDTIWRMAGAARHWPGVIEAIAGVNNLLITFDPERTDVDALTQALAGGWASPPARDHTPALHHVPVRYGGAGGYDLAEVAEKTGMSREDYVKRHAAGDYVVMAIGAQPGFGFLGGMDPEIMVPRRACPRLSVAQGAVSVGGSQTAVATITSPSGWNVLGETDSRFFDLAAARPALLRLGDRVRFSIESFT